MINILFITHDRHLLTIETITSLIELNPEFKDFNWICLDNASTTQDNFEYLKSLDFINYILLSKTNSGIAKATSILSNLCQSFNNDYTLYLQNDWKCLYSNFLPACIEMLEKYPDYFIRLSTKVGQMYNTFTKVPFKYEEEITIDNFEFKLIENGHFSLNPFLILTKHLPLIFPATKERHAQTNFHETHLKRIDMSIETAPFIHNGAGIVNRTADWVR